MLRAAVATLDADDSAVRVRTRSNLHTRALTIGGRRSGGGGERVSVPCHNIDAVSTGGEAHTEVYLRERFTMYERLSELYRRIYKIFNCAISKRHICAAERRASPSQFINERIRMLISFKSSD